MIAVVDYGMGNLRSVEKAVTRLGYNCVVTRDHDVLEKAEKLILPGVGHFRNGMANLEAFGLRRLLDELVMKVEKPVLGICLGMQLMTNRSEEGKCEGLGWIPGETVLLKPEKLKVPHIGWNTLDLVMATTPFSDVAPDDEFYFVHSYCVKCRDEDDILFRTTYGVSFDSGFLKKNITGVQFHPEKSHLTGLKILKGFLNT